MYVVFDEFMMVYFEVSRDGIIEVDFVWVESEIEDFIVYYDY